LIIQDMLRKAAYWILPTGIINLARAIKQKLRGAYADKDILRLCEPNIRFKNIHNGRRCFILCNGPSVNNQNLLSLKNEVVFSVSSGYHHKDYGIIRPKYHCQPGLDYTGKLTKEVYKGWYKEMDDDIGDAEIFLNAKDEPFIRENKLFPNRKVNYLYLGMDWDEGRRALIDITRKAPWVQSVPVMCLMIAMYMGFKNIYLLGVELDSFKTGDYKHFYGSKGVYEDTAVDGNGKLIHPLLEEFKINVKLWTQFRILKNIAQANGISIFNATEGGALDEFERVELSALS
jgi:hypothetical protein